MEGNREGCGFLCSLKFPFLSKINVSTILLIVALFANFLWGFFEYFVQFYSQHFSSFPKWNFVIFEHFFFLPCETEYVILALLHWKFSSAFIIIQYFYQCILCEKIIILTQHPPVAKFCYSNHLSHLHQINIKKKKLDINGYLAVKLVLSKESLRHIYTRLMFHIH